MEETSYDLILKILTNLDPENMSRYIQTNKRILSIYNKHKNTIWNNKLRNDYQLDPVENPMKLYMYLYNTREYYFKIDDRKVMTSGTLYKFISDYDISEEYISKAMVKFRAYPRITQNPPYYLVYTHEHDMRGYDSYKNILFLGIGDKEEKVREIVISFIKEILKDSKKRENLLQKIKTIDDITRIPDYDIKLSDIHYSVIVTQIKTVPI